MAINNKIKIDTVSFDCAETEGIPCINRIYDMSGEEYKRIHLFASVQEIVSAFADNSQCVHEWSEEVSTIALNEDGTPNIDENFLPIMTTSTLTHSEVLAYSLVLGDITLARDGTTYIMIRDKNELELTQEALDSALLRLLTGGN